AFAVSLFSFPDSPSPASLRFGVALSPSTRFCRLAYSPNEITFFPRGFGWTPESVKLGEKGVGRVATCDDCTEAGVAVEADTEPGAPLLKTVGGGSSRLRPGRFPEVEGDEISSEAGDG